MSQRARFGDRHGKAAVTRIGTAGSTVSVVVERDEGARLCWRRGELVRRPHAASVGSESVGGRTREIGRPTARADQAAERSGVTIADSSASICFCSGPAWITMPAPTVSLVASSIRMKPPVVRDRS